MIISKRLKELRKEKGVKQIDVALFLGMSNSGYAGYEQGVRRLPIESLLLLSSYYNVSTDYLLGVTDVRYTQDELNFYNEMKEKNIDQLIKDYNLTLGDESLSEKDERVLIKLIKSFMEN